jgi:hypothetical protein
MKVRFPFVLFVTIGLCAGLISCKKKEAIIGQNTQTYRIDSIRVNNIPFKDNSGAYYDYANRLNLIISLNDIEFQADGVVESQLPVTIKPVNPDDPLYISSGATESNSAVNNGVAYFYILARNEQVAGNFDIQIDKVKVSVSAFKDQKVYTVSSPSGKSSLSLFYTLL